MLSILLIDRLKPFTDLENGLAIGVTFLLAWLTWRWLERPIRSRGLAAVRPLVATMAAIAAVALAPALGYAPPLPVEIAELMKVSPTAEGQRMHECMLSDLDTAPFAPDCVDNKRPLIAIWGDSTAGALMPGWRKLQQTAQFRHRAIHGERVSAAAVPGRTHEPAVPRTQPADCRADIRQRPRCRHVAGELGRRRGGGEAGSHDRGAAFARHVARIVVMGRMPIWRGGLPAIVAAHFRRTGKILPERTTEYVEADLTADRRLRALAASLGVDYISPRDLLCDAAGCLTRIGNTLIAFDTVHLTIRPARSFSRT